MNPYTPANLLPPVASLPEFPSLSESIIYQVNGLIVVFTALSLIWGLLELMALWFKWRARVAKAAAVASAPVAVPAAAASDDLAPELVAAMAAAVHHTLGGTTRITSIVRVDAPDGEWTREGRRQIHSARKVR
jgi:Na+-transporting methylmalonyl-CoA/oxaloacetate decarboxylase gamma subunit